MHRGSFADRSLRSLEPPKSGQIELWDDKIPGFGLRLSPKGSRSFVLVYRFKGRSRRLTLGRYPVLGLADARRRAHQALADVAIGIDPAEEKRRETQNASATAVESVAHEFIEKYARPRNRDWKETERLLFREFVVPWRGREITDIGKSDVIAAIDAITDRGAPGAANRAFAAVRRLFNWCVERDVIAVSPCQGLKSPTKPKARDRVLSTEELVAVWKAAESMGYPFGPIVQLLILTGQRRGEVVSMRWQDIDLDKALWSLPAEFTKAGRAHEVPLSETAIWIISSLPRTHASLLFAARGRDHPVSGFPKWKRELDELSGTADWRLHDLRRTAATGMAEIGVAPHIVERVLNHVSGTFGGVAGVYNRFGYLPEMRDALSKWETNLRTIVRFETMPEREDEV